MLYNTSGLLDIATKNKKYVYTLQKYRIVSINIKKKKTIKETQNSKCEKEIDPCEVMSLSRTI